MPSCFESIQLHLRVRIHLKPAVDLSKAKPIVLRNGIKKRMLIIVGIGGWILTKGQGLPNE